MDITANFHGGETNSIIANAKVNKVKQRETIMNFIAICGARGSYVKEVIRMTGIPHQSTSARLSELKAANKIVPVMVDGKQAKEEGCGVWRVSV